MLYIEVPRFNGMRVVKLDKSTSYRTFCRKVADILGCPVKDLSIGYNAGKAKDLKGKLTARVIEHEEDYDEMVRDSVCTMEDDIARYRKEKAKLAKGAKKGKGKVGAPSKKKALLPQQYIIKLAMVEEETPKKGGTKAKPIKKVCTSPTQFGMVLRRY